VIKISLPIIIYENMIVTYVIGTMSIQFTSNYAWVIVIGL